MRAQKLGDLHAGEIESVGDAAREESWDRSERRRANWARRVINRRTTMFGDGTRRKRRLAVPARISVIA
jgi:hypothetical protein